MRNNRSVFRRVQTRIFVASDFRAGKTFDYILLSRGQLCVNCVLAWRKQKNLQVFHHKCLQHLMHVQQVQLPSSLPQIKEVRLLNKIRPKQTS
ncbi:unnamed protein product [Acanthoscelides obtectus]|uniref:Uncharacterized protein n=2 Tax=Acanthoscelides obtectus TaxID=200917 RepID=A0A9P0JGA6_ACAOB|nr:unnamed protein product [Acanthoscelides obtectus]CAH1964704.1 unnamed protein product [Acanthoscelides obtectus]CAK1625016.1 hypothetical protein AOBTE_LOCUS2893 [Acanthoscelides obtectus]CAK1647272.1 hypothetical protein AOBTE_LOCUS15145 [Acanthoscelides obtectus]